MSLELFSSVVMGVLMAAFTSLLFLVESNLPGGKAWPESTQAAAPGDTLRNAAAMLS